MASDKRIKIYAGHFDGTDRQTDRCQTIALCFLLDAVSVTIPQLTNKRNNSRPVKLITSTANLCCSQMYYTM